MDHEGDCSSRREHGRRILKLTLAKDVELLEKTLNWDQDPTEPLDCALMNVVWPVEIC